MNNLFWLFLMAFLGMQVAGWLLYAVVLFKSGERYSGEVQRDQYGEPI